MIQYKCSQKLTGGTDLNNKLINADKDKVLESAEKGPDMIFYNRLLKCFVIIDLKIGKVTHQDKCSLI